jgi:hypothetical protein
VQLANGGVHAIQWPRRGEVTVSRKLSGALYVQEILSPVDHTRAPMPPEIHATVP